MKGDALLRDWAGSSAQVFFDFCNNGTQGDEEILWWLAPESDDQCAYVAPYPRAKFIEYHLQTSAQRARDRDPLLSSYVAAIAHEKRRIQESKIPIPPPAPPRRWKPPHGFSQERMEKFLAAERERRLAKTDGEPTIG